MKIIDLSQDIFEGMPVYPGHLKTVQFVHATHEETSQRFDSGFSYQTTGLLLNDNGPTHVDSFSHLDPATDALTIDLMPLDIFAGPALCLDVSDVPPMTDISDQRLDRALEESGLSLPPAMIVLLYTGTFGRHGGTPEYLTQFPGLGLEGSEWMVKKRVKAFGVDSPTPDNPISTTYPCHLMSRRHRITHYENLANLGVVAGKRFFFVGLPLKIRNGHGGPTRAAAIMAWADEECSL